MSRILTLWRFSRPHTLIGTVISVTVLFSIATGQVMVFPFYFWLSLLSAMACNIFITGYNQLIDITLDQVNKPDLPLASGELSVVAGRRVVYSALFISLILAFYLSIPFGILVGLIAAIGFLYSWKQVYLKSSHFLAAFAITVVRGLLINLGFYLHFLGLPWDLAYVPVVIWLLAIFVILFSLGIAWFKDIPDMKGDAMAKVQSLSVKIGAHKTFSRGVVVVGIGYVMVSGAALFIDMPEINTSFLALGNAFLGFCFLILANRTQPLVLESMKLFYKGFWVLFALEYVVFGFGGI